MEGEMATFKRFEDIEAWKKARVYARKVYKISRSGEFGRDFTLRNQICSSTGSIMSNIAEGFGRDGNKEFLNFLSIAKGSAEESKSQLYIAIDQEYIDEITFNYLYNSAREIGLMIYGLMKYLRTTKTRGMKFKAV